MPKKKLDRYEFIWKAIQKHGYKYDYKKVNYIDSKTKVCIICPEHGEFWQTPNNHLNKHECPKCAGVAKLNTIEFIKKSKDIHGDKYDYSKVDCVNSQTKINIICKKHGEFKQLPSNHLKGQGCPKCANKGGDSFGSYTNKEFIEKAKLIHSDKYDYSKVEYINSQTKICILCPEHGEFWQKPDSHLQGKGCSKCAGKFLDRDLFIKKAQKIHDYKYDYSKVEYKRNKEKVCIICPKHGEFWQSPNDHLTGYGCPICNESKLEKEIYCLLKHNKIRTERQKRFNWLGLQSLDFYLPDYNIAIECQGRQHFEPVKQFGGEKEFEKTIERDKKKIELCVKNNIKLLHYTKSNIKNYCNEYKLITSKHKLLKEICTQLSTL